MNKENKYRNTFNTVYSGIFILLSFVLFTVSATYAVNAATEIGEHGSVVASGSPAKSTGLSTNLSEEEYVPEIILPDDQKEFAYDGKVHFPDKDKITVKITVDGKKVTLSKDDYTLEADPTKMPGIYSFMVKLKNGLSGSAEGEYSIILESDPEIIFFQTEYEYDGNIKHPLMYVVVDSPTGEIYLGGSNYTAEGWNYVREIGDYTVKVTLKNGYIGTGYAEYHILEEGSLTAALSDVVYSYDGTAKNPEVRAWINHNILDPSEYTVEGLGAVNVGTHTVKITYTADKGTTKTATAQYRIIRVYAEPEVSLSSSTLTYNGREQMPSVTVKVNGARLDASEYDIAGGAHRDPGEYSLKVVLKGNYAGEAEAAYKIVNAAPAPSSGGSSGESGSSAAPSDPHVRSDLVTVQISKLKAKKKQFYVYWKKASRAKRKKIDGYQVQYSTSSNFSGKVYTKTAKKNTVKKYYSKKLKSRKVYYVRLRTFRKIKGVRYYSPWSAVVSVRTK